MDSEAREEKQKKAKEKKKQKKKQTKIRKRGEGKPDRAGYLLVTLSVKSKNRVKHGAKAGR